MKANISKSHLNYLWKSWNMHRKFNTPNLHCNICYCYSIYELGKEILIIKLKNILLKMALLRENANGNKN